MNKKHTSNALTSTSMNDEPQIIPTNPTNEMSNPTIPDLNLTSKIKTNTSWQNIYNKNYLFQKILSYSDFKTIFHFTLASKACEKKVHEAIDSIYEFGSITWLPGCPMDPMTKLPIKILNDLFLKYILKSKYMNISQILYINGGIIVEILDSKGNQISKYHGCDIEKNGIDNGCGVYKFNKVKRSRQFKNIFTSSYHCAATWKNGVGISIFNHQEVEEIYFKEFEKNDEIVFVLFWKDDATCTVLFKSGKYETIWFQTQLEQFDQTKFPGLILATAENSIPYTFGNTKTNENL